MCKGRDFRNGQEVAVELRDSTWCALAVLYNLADPVHFPYTQAATNSSTLQGSSFAL